METSPPDGTAVRLDHGPVVAIRHTISYGKALRCGVESPPGAHGAGRHASGAPRRVVFEGPSVRLTASVLLSVVALSLAACGGRTAASSSPAAALASSPSPSPSAPASHVGDTITDTEGDEFTVYQVVPFTSANQFEQPKAGYVFVAIDVKEKAGSKGLSANPFDFAVVMEDDTRYQPTLGYKDPSLHATGLADGQAVRGWITFEVLASVKLVRVALADSTDIFWDVP